METEFKGYWVNLNTGSLAETQLKYYSVESEDGLFCSVESKDGFFMDC